MDTCRISDSAILPHSQDTATTIFPRDPLALCHISHLVVRHELAHGESSIIMPPWSSYTIQQARTDDKVANAILHPHILHLLIENVFSFLCFATLYF